MAENQYKCKNCGYVGDKLVYQFTDYTCCVATNTDEPNYISEPPDWVLDKGVGEAKIEEAVGCLKCHAWGVANFERI